VARVELVGVSKRRGGRAVVDNVHLTVADGEFVCILAPPNHGKTTLLRLIAGLERLDQGDILVDGVSVIDLPVQVRGIGMVFEDLAVFPHWTGFDNLAHPLRVAGASQEEVSQRVSEVARLLGIEGMLERMPSTFSGGEQQRVAIGRALIRRPALLLMDQPLSDLDALIRQEMTVELKRLQQETGQTIVYATHDFEEAMAMADRVVVLDLGRVVQDAPTEQVYEWPASEHVATTMGNPQINLLTCSVSRDEGRLVLRHPGFAFEPDGWDSRIGKRAEVRLGIRPENLRLLDPEGVTPDEVGLVSAPATVEVVQYLGDERITDVELGGERLKAVGPPSHSLAMDDPVLVVWDPSAIRLFDAETREALSDPNDPE
jgi:multiple sugar transport system ATP-binding protein